MTNKAIPFLRWAGSKRDLIKDISKYIPATFNKYHEPFLGSGALYFHLNRKDSYLSDSNHNLINAYIQIRDHASDIVSILKSYKNEEPFYYDIRNKVFDNQIEAAAQFIFLNKTCYNGLYRVNSKGIFNVPFGRRKNVDYVSENIILEASKSLKNAIITNSDFYESVNNVAAGDLVFIDPPYVISRNNNSFIEYNQKIFTWEDQHRLHSFVLDIIDRGAYFILTNASDQCILDLYNDICSPHEITRMSKIGGKNSYRGAVTEYLFTNCGLL